MKLKRKNRIILALDLLEEKKALRLVERTKNYIDAIKIGYPLLLACGLGIVRKIKKIAKKPVIADLKLADIDNTNLLISKKVISSGADYIIAHGFVGGQALRILNPEKTFLVVQMSHKGSEQFINRQTKKLCAMANQLKVYGVIAPATRIGEIRKIRKWVGGVILSPGVGAQGGDAKKALKAGADFLIIGRSIYNSKNPERVLKYILNSIQPV